MSAQFPVHIQKSNSSDFKGHKATLCNYSKYLKERGHREGTLHAYCSALTHFLRWLTTESPQRQLINIVTVDAFLNEHLPVCNCLPPVYKEYKTVRAALNQLLLLQGESRVKTFAAETTSAVGVTLHEFDVFLRDVCGLSESTRFYRQRFVGSFLHWLSDTSRLYSAKITSKDLVRFVTDQAGHLKPSSIGVLLTSLRSYLRFLQFKGESNISLLAAVPKPPNWSLASLPHSLPVSVMRKLVDFLPRLISLHLSVNVITAWHVA